jgi:hypothetical protein
MTCALARLAATVQARLGELVVRPFSLVCLLLAANALAMPYVGFSHDSRLYAVQLAERLQPGTFGDDLYLRYGSQNRFSIFTLVMAPLVWAVGLQAAFFAVYLASKALFFWGLARLVRVLVPDGAVAVLSLLALAIVPLPFGGNAIFHLNESFLTPRIASCGLVLLGLEQMLAGRVWAALVLLAAALVMHPLMAPAGVLTALAWWLFMRRNRMWLLVLGGLLLVAGVCLGYQPLGERLLGHIDEEWRGIYLNVCFYIDPGQWSAGDWARILLGILVTVVAAVGYARSHAAFLLAVLAAGLAGLAGTFVTLHTSYLLLYQVSPYRTLWLLELLAIPLAVWGLVVLWRRHTASLLALPGLALLAAYDWSQLGSLEPCLILITLPASIIVCRGLGRTPRPEDWVRRSAAASLTVSVLLLAAYNLFVFVLLFSYRPTFHLDTHPVQILRAAPALLYRLPELLAAVALAAWLLSRLGPGRRFQLACVGLWLGYQAAIAAVPEAAWYRRHFTAGQPPRDFVADFVHERARDLGRTPTVYWPTDLRDIWLLADARSFFSSVQLSGCGFNRGTALEGKRRALLVGPFEAASLRRFPPLEPWWCTNLCRFYEVDEDEAPPRAEDLFRLSREEGLDFIVVEDAVDGLYCASDGRYYIYDCTRLRELERQHKALPREADTEAGGRMASALSRRH